MNSQLAPGFTSAGEFAEDKGEPQPSKPIHVMKTKDIYKSGIKIGSVNVLLNLSNRIIVPGGTMTFTAELMNHSKDLVVIVAAAIIVQETMQKSRGKLIKSEETICSVEGPQCVNNRLIVWTGRLPVTTGLPLTPTSCGSTNNNVVSVHHNFRIIAKLVTTNEILLELQVPITILNTP